MTNSIVEQNAVLKPLDDHILHLRWIWGTVTPTVKLWPENEKVTMKQMVTNLSEEIRNFKPDELNRKTNSFMNDDCGKELQINRLAIYQRNKIIKEDTGNANGHPTKWTCVEAIGKACESTWLPIRNIFCAVSELPNSTRTKHGMCLEETLSSELEIGVRVLENKIEYRLKCIVCGNILKKFGTAEEALDAAPDVAVTHRLRFFGMETETMKTFLTNKNFNTEIAKCDGGRCVVESRVGNDQMLLTSYIYEKGFFDNQNRWKVRLHWERLHKILLQESEGHLASKLILNTVRKLASKWLRSLEFGEMSWVFKLLDGIEVDYFSDTPLRALTTINIDSDQVVRPKKEALLERTLQNNLTRIMKVDWKDKSREMKSIPPSFSEKDKRIMQQIMTKEKLHSVHQLGILPYVMKLKKEEDNVIIEFYRQYPSVTYPYAQQCGNGKEYFFLWRKPRRRCTILNICCGMYSK